ncbi:MAG: hypothetical protein ABR614_03450 [Mycobacteriales bacterium]
MTDTHPWPPEQGATIQRLAFLAAQPALRRLARPWWLALLRGAEVYGGPYSGRSAMTQAARDAERTSSTRFGPPTMASEIRSGRMASYAFACDRVAEKLSVDERQALRESGSLPDWFLPEVQRAAERIRKVGASAR